MSLLKFFYFFYSHLQSQLFQISTALSAPAQNHTVTRTVGKSATDDNEAAVTGCDYLVFRRKKDPFYCHTCRHHQSSHSKSTSQYSY